MSAQPGKRNMKCCLRIKTLPAIAVAFVIVTLLLTTFPSPWSTDKYKYSYTTHGCIYNLTHFKPCLQTIKTQQTKEDHDVCPDTRCAIDECVISVTGYRYNSVLKDVSLKINNSTVFVIKNQPGFYMATLSSTHDTCSYTRIDRFSDPNSTHILQYLTTISRGTTVVGISSGEYFLSQDVKQALNITFGVQFEAVSPGAVLSFMGKAGFTGFANFTWEEESMILTHIYRYFIGKEVIPTWVPESWNELAAIHKLGMGGTYTPPHCTPRYKIAIIIPFRAREQHLRVLINNMVPFLKAQMIAFTIFVIEQEPLVIFNRAMLLNIGYMEAKNLSNYDCYVFHDVDLIPLDFCNSYYCSLKPRHLVTVRNKTKYMKTNFTYFGGGNILNDTHMQLVNGFSNRFFGWGKEDDEFLGRIQTTKLGFLEQPDIIGRYDMIAHGNDTGNPRPNLTLRQAYANAAFYRMDGLNSLTYNRTKIKFQPLFTHIRVSFPGPTSEEELDIYKTRIGKKPTTVDLELQKR